ncbi:hypothetical protein D6783_00795 [Candidatus Woesearchaeota archaeon]|nr:MAG: hypothetical protein D6783_00795 [Candidatus Woesearchaeota archaeon]
MKQVKRAKTTVKKNEALQRGRKLRKEKQRAAPKAREAPGQLEGLSQQQRTLLKLIKEVGKVTTTSEVAALQNISWNTAEKYLLELALLGRVRRLKKAGVNLWVLQ